MKPRWLLPACCVVAFAGCQPYSDNYYRERRKRYLANTSRAAEGGAPTKGKDGPEQPVEGSPEGNGKRPPKPTDPVALARWRRVRQIERILEEAERLHPGGPEAEAMRGRLNALKEALAQP